MWIPPRMLLNLISQEVFSKSFCKSQFPHKSVDLSFIIYHYLYAENMIFFCGN